HRLQDRQSETFIVRGIDEGGARAIECREREIVDVLEGVQAAARSFDERARTHRRSSGDHERNTDARTLQSRERFDQRLQAFARIVFAYEENETSEGRDVERYRPRADWGTYSKWNRGDPRRRNV